MAVGTFVGCVVGVCDGLSVIIGDVVGEPGVVGLSDGARVGAMEYGAGTNGHSSLTRH